ncbi:MAG: 50S ribosomal protein L29 [Candidatus Muiribacteriota bacterium]|jgi:large subunit ribosomal protein L29
MKANELRELTIDELTTKENDFKQELFNLRFQAVTGKLENTARLRQVRKDIAKIKTVIREKQLATDGGNA